MLKQSSFIIVLVSFGLFFSADGFCQGSDLNKSTYDSGSSYSYAFINPKFNVFQYANKALIDSLMIKLEKSRYEKTSILHFGDSHVQLDHFVSALRHSLDSVFGNAGRGMIFPFNIAKTYSHTDYNSTFTGEWLSANSIQNPPKIPVGVSGFVAKTNDDSATFTIKFKRGMKADSYAINVFHKMNKGSFDVSLGDTVAFSKVYSNNIMTRFEMNQSLDSLSLKVKNSNNDTSNFYFYGMSLEKKSPGIIYHNLGVGGASYCALLQQKYFDEQFNFLQPDIVLLDWGTNDIIYHNQISDTLEKTIVNTIKKIRSNNPNVSIILFSVQDMNYKGKNVTICKNFSDLIRKVAIQEGCIFYDWFYVAGGRYSMKKWESNLLGRKDNIHLTAEGYKLKSSLFLSAIINGLKEYRNKNLGDNFILPTPIDNFVPSPPILKEKLVNKKSKKSNNSKKSTLKNKRN